LRRLRLRTRHHVLIQDIVPFRPDSRPPASALSKALRNGRH